MENSKEKTMSKTTKMGRPTKYKPEYCEKLIEHFNIPFYKTIIEEKMSASGAVKELKRQVPNDFPTLEGFCRKIGITPDTIQNWAKANDDFLRALKIAKGIQKEFLTTHGLSGAYNNNFAKFISVNLTDYIDKSEVKTENEHNVKGYGLAFDLTTKPEDL